MKYLKAENGEKEALVFKVDASNLGNVMEYPSIGPPLIRIYQTSAEIEANGRY
jgi:hypothetical protein